MKPWRRAKGKCCQKCLSAKLPGCAGSKTFSSEELSRHGLESLTQTALSSNVQTSAEIGQDGADFMRPMHTSMLYHENPDRTQQEGHAGAVGEWLSVPRTHVMLVCLQTSSWCRASMCLCVRTVLGFAGQALYLLNRVTSPFCCSYFCVGSQASVQGELPTIVLFMLFMQVE
jgi:hypothetical protein